VADNAAQIVITTNSDEFKKFIQDAINGFDDMRKHGKSSMGDLASFAKATLGGALLSAGKDLAGAITKPLSTSFAQATDDARAFRQENTRIASSLGQDWRKVGTEIDAQALRLRRAPEDVRGYGEAVRELTGSWQSAQGSVEAYSKLATYLGKKSVEEMAVLAGTMENAFGVKGSAKSQEFFDGLIRRAEALGQSGQQAVNIFSRLSGGMQGPKDGGRVAGQNAAMIPALQSMGASPEEAAKISSGVNSFFSGNLDELQGKLTRWGTLKKGDTLRDSKNFNRLRYSQAELMGMIRDTVMKQAGGNDRLALRRLNQNFSPEVASAIMMAPELQQTMAYSTMAAASGVPSALDRAGAASAGSEEGQARAAEIQKQIDDRAMGSKLLAVQDGTRGVGGVPGAIASYGVKGVGTAVALEAGKAGLAYMGLGGAAGAAGAGSAALGAASGFALPAAAVMGAMANDQGTIPGFGAAAGGSSMTTGGMDPGADRAATIRHLIDRVERRSGGGFGGWLQGVNEAPGQNERDLQRLQQLDPQAADRLVQKFQQGPAIPVRIQQSWAPPMPSGPLQ